MVRISAAGHPAVRVVPLRPDRGTVCDVSSAVCRDPYDRNLGIAYDVSSSVNSLESGDVVRACGWVPGKFGDYGISTQPGESGVYQSCRRSHPSYESRIRRIPSGSALAEENSRTRRNNASIASCGDSRARALGSECPKNVNCRTSSLQTRLLPPSKRTMSHSRKPRKTPSWVAKSNPRRNAATTSYDGSVKYIPGRLHTSSNCSRKSTVVYLIRIRS